MPMSAWVKDIVRSQSETVVSPKGDELPKFPPEQLQINTTGRAGVAAIEQAAFFYEDVMQGLSKSGAVVGNDWKLLDFGSGWGRITRVALKDFRMSNIVGIDVDEQFVALSNDLFPQQIFKVCNPYPPTDIASSSIQLVLAYSVFSHLSEDASRAWIAEFLRVLAPGGYAAFTTRPIAFVDYCEHLAKSKDGIVDRNYQEKLASMFSEDGAAACKRAYGEGQYVFMGIGGGGVRDGSFYGEAFIPAAWIERNFGESFEIVFAEYRPERYDQLCFLLKKKGMAENGAKF